MPILKKFDTSDDRKYFDEKAKILEAHRAGKLGKSWYKLNPEKGTQEIKPKSVFKRI